MGKIDIVTKVIKSNAVEIIIVSTYLFLLFMTLIVVFGGSPIKVLPLLLLAFAMSAIYNMNDDKKW